MPSLSQHFAQNAILAEVFCALIRVFSAQFSRNPQKVSVWVNGPQLDGINEALYSLADMRFSSFGTSFSVSNFLTSDVDLLIDFLPNPLVSDNALHVSNCGKSVINGNSFYNSFVAVSNSLPTLPTTLGPRKLLIVFCAVFLRHRSLGCVFEGGVYRGGNTVFVRKILEQLGSRKSVYSFDTFSGMPPPSVHDLSGFHFAEGHFKEADLGTVITNLAAFGIDSSGSIFQATIDENFPFREMIKGCDLAILDMDSFTGMYHGIRMAYELGAANLLAVIDDTELDGVRSAVERSVREFDLIFSKVMFNLGVLAIPQGRKLKNQMLGVQVQKI